MAFLETDLLDCLPASSPLLVAYSGGMDSHVLLYALCRLRETGLYRGRLRAIHVHHGLQPGADDWAGHCRQVCESLNIPLEIVRVAVGRDKSSLENEARKVRLRVFAEHLQEGEGLLQAHHLDDQMETILFRLMRGTGLKGLAGIRQSRRLGAGKILRPLLGFTRKELEEYAVSNSLAWITDDSNVDTGFDRNFLRHQVLPLLESRWPGFRKNWQRLAQLAGEGQQLQHELGLQDLAGVRDGIHRLQIQALQRFSELRRRNILRSWFLALEAEHGVAVPDYTAIRRIMDEVIPAAEDAGPVVAWTHDHRRVEVRRFAGYLYLVLPPAVPEPAGTFSWQPDSILELPDSLGTLRFVETDGDGVDPSGAGRLEVSFKKGGEKAKPAGRKTRSLKKILQDYRVPPWLRNRVPLIYAGGSLMAAGDLFITDAWRTGKEQAGGRKLFRIRWDRSDLHCGY